MTRWILERIAYAATRFGFSLGCLAVRILPRRWLFLFSDALANAGFALFRGFRIRSIRNISLALPDGIKSLGTHQTARRSLRNFFRACVEIVIALESTDEMRRSDIAIVGREYLDRALAKGNGVIVLSAHLGNFFLVGTHLAIEGYPTYVLVNQPNNGKFAMLMDYYRLQVRQKTIHARPRREALKELRQVLRQNEVAMMIADEFRRGKGISVPLFGRTVLARRGPATLALRTGAAVVPACMVRQADDSLRLIIEPELELVRTGKTKEAIRENTLCMTRWLERMVRAYPDQWNWMNIRWQDDSGRAIKRKEHPIEELTQQQMKGDLR